jgi:hypothetical protein
MLKVGLVTLHRDKVEAFKAWKATLARRKDEVLETFEAESTRSEFVAILNNTDPPVVVYAMEAVDFAKADEAFKHSAFPIDIAHKAVLNDCLSGRAPHEVLSELGTLL